MSSRDDFVNGRRAAWAELESLLERGPLYRLPPDTISRTAALYRAACADLMRAESLGLGSDVTGHLDALIARGHGALYGPRQYSGRAAWQLVAHTFPVTLRRNARFFWVALALFGIPLAVGWVGALRSEEFAFSLIPREVLQQSLSSYLDDVGRGGGGADAAMAGFYVHNNVGIAFRCFATGILFGVGSVFFLFYNGLAIGATFGFVVGHGAGQNLLSFASGHASFELTAIVIAGSAGLRMGYALIATHGRTRLASLRASSLDVGVLILGAALLLLVAAAIEGFWSATSVSLPIKWSFAALSALTVGTFLLLGGRKAVP